ncbi:tryptophan halogenase family protein [Amphiplicatus metriothermophilus]|uniref:Tryptophan halogenase n=1 Tax=Amphiplicatus metriothermophilus TaxID=1519374 RepID=A0A239PR14_9PROT|nr:tryptophan halogenase family protein [Amphiplicatus metriothermophilus]MBB5518477.1 flavin-dependent dehydrogenase [Amphiplicatus metriothermophilus]SNT72362.1 Tryptophan halogenase [Amphiplicatus metriothermophilus]
MTDEVVKSVMIVGGGAAGWLTAAVIAAEHCAHSEEGLEVTVVESPNIPIIGVGEGTWPSIRDTLRRIGIRETEFIRRCNASFKQGTRFDGWRDGSSGDSYFHPFDPPPGPDEVDMLALWRAAPAGAPFAQAIGCQAALCLAGKAPKQKTTPEYAAVVNYAYHLDAPAFANLLREHCVRRLGVRVVPDDVVGVETDEAGFVRTLNTRRHGALQSDLYIDCTGSRALLIGDALGVKAKDVSHILFNDRALALHVPYMDENAPIASQTTGTAMGAGWIWDIALQSRRGVGYVYASGCESEEDARAELASYLRRVSPPSGANAEDARLIRFSSAYRETPWVRNVVAVGMAQGFVEPLEASAIVMVELSARMISDTLPARRTMMQRAAERFNARFAYRWERIVDFLKLHYALSRRAEDYWRAHAERETWPARLAGLLEQWRFDPPSREDFTDALEIFPAASYAFVLYGMGFETARRPLRRRKDDPRRVARHLSEIAARGEKFLGGLPSNRELIDHALTNGLMRV